MKTTKKQLERALKEVCEWISTDAQDCPLRAVTCDEQNWDCRNCKEILFNHFIRKAKEAK